MRAPSASQLQIARSTTQSGAKNGVLAGKTRVARSRRRPSSAASTIAATPITMASHCPVIASQSASGS
ncbi:MAG TPA: hypothetical protein VGJ12_01545, partial [Gemmatimonadaceae bacterium]